MSQTTRCPHCATTFRVVADQLRIGQGWVRCGQCKQVFDATEQLQALAPEPPLSASPPPAALPPEPPPAASLPSEALPPEPESAAQPAPEPEPEPAPEPEPEPGSSSEAAPPAELPPVADGPSVQSLAAVALAQEVEPVEGVKALAGPAESVESAAELAPAAVPLAAPAPAPEPQHPAEPEPEPEPEFVRAARREAFWRHPAVRGVLTLLALALLVLLAGQVGVQHRDALVARLPALRAVLQPVCQSLGCRLAAPRELGAVVIDSSSFVRASASEDGYVLRFVLKNTAPYIVAMPMIELTLTDSRDQTLVRRVLDPVRELGAATELPAQGQWHARAGLEVAGANQPVTGYRLLAFYP